MDNGGQPHSLFFLAPAWRSYKSFPWYVWGAGWIAILKATVWVFFEPVDFNAMLYWKCLVFSLPFLVFASGVWSLKKWAITGVAVLAVIDLLILISGVIPGESLISSTEFLQRPTVEDLMTFLYVGVFICGRAGDVALIIAAPYILRYRKKWESGLQKQAADPIEYDGLKYFICVIYVFLFIIIGYSLISLFS